VRLEGVDRLKKFIHLIGSRTRDLPACSIVPQPLLCYKQEFTLKSRVRVVLWAGLD
jgi:hypothetical protein